MFICMFIFIFIFILFVLMFLSSLDTVSLCTPTGLAMMGRILIVGSGNSALDLCAGLLKAKGKEKGIEEGKGNGKEKGMEEGKGKGKEKGMEEGKGKGRSVGAGVFSSGLSSR